MSIMRSLNLGTFRIFIIPFAMASMGLSEQQIQVSLYSESCELVRRFEVDSLAIPENKYMIYYPVGEKKSQIWILYGIDEINITYGETEFVFRRVNGVFQEVKRSGCFQVT